MTDPAAPDSPTGIYDSTYKGKTDSLYFYQQLKDLQAEYEAYKESLDLRWSNPNRDQEIERQMLNLWKHKKEQAQMMSRLQDILTKGHTPTDMAGTKFSLDIPSGGYAMYEITNKNTGEKLYKTGDIMYNVNSSLYPESMKEKAKGLIVSSDNKEAFSKILKTMLKNMVRLINPITEIAKYNAKITGVIITIVSLT